MEYFGIIVKISYPMLKWDMSNEVIKKECSECDELISPKRLQAKPNTNLCIRCQELKEASGDFVLASIEVKQEINGWTFEGQENKIIKGD